MEQDIEVQKVHAVDEIKFINKYQLLLKRNLKFLVSVFLFSLFLCYSSSLGFCLFNPYSLNQFNVYFSTCLLSVFTHTLERKYMFLICNGILAFLAKSSISCSSTGTTTSVHFESDDESQLSDVIGGKSSASSNLSEIKAAAVNEEVPAEIIGSLHYVADHHQGELEQQTTEEEEEEEDGQQEDQQNESLYTEKEEISTRALISEDDEEEEEEEGSGSCLMKQQEEEIDTAAVAANDEDYLISSSSTDDELNKKFEEFIRKMKEEIRIEAQRQPIAV